MEVKEEVELEKSKVVVDTNVLIDSPEILLDGKFHYLVPYTVLHELDGLKKNIDLNYAVRHAIKIIYQQMKVGVVEITNIPTAYHTNDEKIVKAAKTANCSLLTNDIGAMAVAVSRHVPVIEEEDDESAIEGFTGYQEVEADLSYEDYVSHKFMQVTELEHMFDIELKINEYLIVNRLNGEYQIWKEEKADKDGNRRCARISQSMKPYKNAKIMITPIDSYQQVAWDSAFSDVPLTVLEGKVGSSKTLSALVGMLVRSMESGDRGIRKFSKIYYSRAPIPVDRSLQLGFMPGDMAEKSSQWIAGISSNLKFLFGKDDGEKVLQEYFEFVSLESVQGLSLMPDEALFIDEYQLLSRDMLKQVLSRVGQGGKVILAGDPAGQTYGVNRSREGFKVIKKYIGKTDFISYVKETYGYIQCI